MEALSVYVIRNAAGQYYQSYAVKGRSGGWVDDVRDARVYTRPGPAKGMVTRFNRLGPPVELVEFMTAPIGIIDKTSRILNVLADYLIEDDRLQEEFARQLREAMGDDDEIPFG